MVIPKKHYENIFDIPEDELLHIMKAIKKTVNLYNAKLGLKNVQIINSSGAEAKQNVHIMKWLREYAPGIFIHTHVKQRVNIYGMRYELDILRNYPMADWPIERLKKYLCGMNW